ncbi:hypothetical protein MLD38_007705 [Melastoma candidum]|uniref:Uncharacterized protein n=1 Tax=Melastoma candidum TaxID=119954 RepID=A0ACB9RW92_9MYRT|nr:hypothetical protein MLD38_007705 [Melastoma candidum]
MPPEWKEVLPSTGVLCRSLDLQLTDSRTGKEREELPPLNEVRARCISQFDHMRSDHMRRLNPTPYKVRLILPYFLPLNGPPLPYLTRSFPKQVRVSAKLYDFIHFLWLNEAPVGELQ